MSRILRRISVAVVTVATSTVLAGTGLAYWSSTGSGSGTATTATPVSVTVNASTSPAAVLRPGGAGAAYFTLTNTNGFTATFNKVTAASVVSNDTTHCPSANASIAQVLPYTFSPTVSVGAKATSGMLNIPNLVQLASAAPNGCEGVIFTVTLTLSGTTN